MPATVARPRKPILAITTNINIITPNNEGIKASIPPDLESFSCFAARLDFFFFVTIRLWDGDGVDVIGTKEELIMEILDKCFDHSLCRSRFWRRLLVCDIEDNVDNEEDSEVREASILSAS